MDVKRFKVLLLLLVVSLFVLIFTVGCGQAGNEETATPSGPEELTAETLASYNSIFEPIVTDEQGNTDASEISCFFTSYYDKPENIDLVKFLKYCPIGTLVEDEEEYQAIKATSGDENMPDDLKDYPTPIHKFAKADVDALLSKYAGVTTSDLNGIPEGNTELVYVDKTNAYYNFTSDFGPGSFEAVSGEKNENIITLKDDRGRTLILEETGDGFMIKSFTLE